MVFSGCVAALAILVRNWPLRLMSFASQNLRPQRAGRWRAVADRPFGTITVLRYWIQYLPSVALVIGGLTGLPSPGWCSGGGPPGGQPWPWRPRWPSPCARCRCGRWPDIDEDEEAFAPNGGDALEDLREHLAATGFTTDEGVDRLGDQRTVPPYERDPFGGKKVWARHTQEPHRRPHRPGEPYPGDAVLLFSARDMTCQWCRTGPEAVARRAPDRPGELGPDVPQRDRRRGALPGQVSGRPDGGSSPVGRPSRSTHDETSAMRRASLV